MSWLDNHVIELVGGYFDGFQQRSTNLPEYWQMTGQAGELITYKRTSDKTGQGAWRYILDSETFPQKGTYHGAFD